MKFLCNQKDNYSIDETDNFDKLFHECFFSIKTKDVQKLLVKAMENINKISKEAILFLMTLDQKSLDILKKQFQYAVIINNFGFIVFYDNIENDLEKLGLNLIGCGDKLKFLNNIWIMDLNLRKCDLNLPRVQLCNVFIQLIKFNNNSLLYIKKQNIESDRIIELDIYAQLTEVGMQIFDLLKDEIDKVDKNYPDEILKYHQKNILN